MAISRCLPVSPSQFGQSHIRPLGAIYSLIGGFCMCWAQTFLTVGHLIIMDRHHGGRRTRCPYVEQMPPFGAVGAPRDELQRNISIIPLTFAIGADSPHTMRGIIQSVSPLCLAVPSLNVTHCPELDLISLLQKRDVQSRPVEHFQNIR